MDIYTLIRQDHDDVRIIIEQISLIPDSRHHERVMAFKFLRSGINAHSEAEEASFYAALAVHDGMEDIIANAKREHDLVEALMTELEEEKMTPTAWRTKFTEFQRAMFQHIRDEENIIFSMARDIFTTQNAVDLAGIMQNLKHMKHSLLRKAG